MKNKYLIRNKKKYKGLFNQFTHTGNEVIKLIKDKKIKKLDIVNEINKKN